MKQNTYRDPIEYKRMGFTISVIKSLGYEITYQDDTRFEFMFKGHLVKLYPYTGWHTGKSIRDGRGFFNLKKQLKKTNNEKEQ